MGGSLDCAQVLDASGLLELIYERLRVGKVEGQGFVQYVGSVRSLEAGESVPGRCINHGSANRSGAVRLMRPFERRCFGKLPASEYGLELLQGEERCQAVVHPGGCLSAWLSLLGNRGHLDGHELLEAQFSEVWR